MNWRASIVAAIVATLTVASTGQAVDIYPLLGNGDAELLSGVLAPDADIRSGPSGIAIRDDGVIAFATLGAVYWVENGLVRRVPLPAHGDLDATFTPDGRLIVASCGLYGGGPGLVFDAAPGRAALPLAGRP